MDKEYVPYDVAVAMKELGFDNVPCMGVYYNVTNVEDIDINCEKHFSPCNYETQYYANKRYKNAVLAPLYQQAFRWFREKYQNETFILSKCSFVGTILRDGFNGELKGYYYSITEDGFINYHQYHSIDDSKWFDTYQEAEIACLRKLIEIVKENEVED